MTPTPRNDSASLLNRRYLACLGLVALLLFLNQAIVQPQLLALAFDPTTINRAGRQRMLSQRIAKAALAAERSKLGVERTAYLAELARASEEWSDSHAMLRRGATTGPAAIRSAFEEVAPSFLRLQKAAADLVRAGSADDVAIGRILGEEAAYLRGMERIVGLYEAEARGRAERLLWTGRILTALILAALAGLGWLVLWPASAIIRRQMDDLRHARDDLEIAVRERTRDLEAEAARRALAESRHRAVLELASHAARVSTLGEMASSLAHELNQPLGAIANYAEGCEVELSGDEPDRAALRSAMSRIVANALRAGEIIKRVRRFVTRHEFERQPIDVPAFLEEAADLLRDEARRRRIALQVRSAPGLPYVLGDGVQIQQVLINLVRNAFDAVDASKTEDRSVLIAAESHEKGTVRFRVIDRGEGLSEETEGRIFEPYFSTRADGMGMGLAISRTIVEAHGGTLSVESQPGAGAEFQFSLPTVEAGDHAGRHGLRR